MYKGQKTGGGGSQRRVVSKFLQQAGMPRRTKEDHRLAFRAANQHYRDVRDAGGVEWATSEKKAGQALSHTGGLVMLSAGGKAAPAAGVACASAPAALGPRSCLPGAAMGGLAAVEEALGFHCQSQSVLAVAARQKQAQQEAKDAETQTGHRCLVS